MLENKRNTACWRGSVLLLAAMFGLTLGSQGAEPSASPSIEPVLELLDDAAAWQLLPKATQGQNAPLPTWARMLAKPLPKTTAAMLEFDTCHRTRSPLDPKLRARLRWLVALSNRCAYTKIAAAHDLARAGASSAELSALQRGDTVTAWNALSKADRDALEFARTLTRKGAELTDEQFTSVLDAFGEAPTVAIVLLTAGANFQDRLFLALGVPLETDTRRIAPVAVEFATLAPPAAPNRKPSAEAKRSAPIATVRVADPDVDAERRFAEVQHLMTSQKDKKPRIRVPTLTEYLEAVKKHPRLATKARTGRGTRVLWSLVCSGYQPELASAWSNCTGNFRAETHLDRVFEESLFLVVTNTIDCFY